MKSSIIFIALVGAVSSNYAAAADHSNMNMLRGIIPAEELLELECPEEGSCSTFNRMQPCRFFCDGGTTDGTCTGAPDSCGAIPNSRGCNMCCECPGGGGGSTERKTNGIGSCKSDNSLEEFLTTEETEFTCDCDDDTDCDDGYSCKNKNKCDTSDPTDPTETSEDVKAEYEFEE